VFGLFQDYYFENCDGFILVYFVTSKESFNYLIKIALEIKQFRRSSTPTLLIGNKIDLEKERQVNKDEGQAFARHLNYSFMEFSAKLQSHVAEVYLK
jgi:GTPase SAR1 family protein